ncbi:flagellar protein FliT [Massilia arenosa]|uniref:Flagellar protein FliT n=1 Tax=Zemynaea arenosa TaxID=2561931 RepID=A0A4Y9SA14_9BURK|nr:flagellar protein FliT [Massilia arenosa]TFW18626.1 flagellar protein FliT [Massilia arenosa]
MMTSEEVASVYEAMVALTDQMVQAAESSDWDRLVLLEQQCAVHVLRLKDNEPVGPLQAADRTRKVTAIRKMLDDDRRIRDLTMPWMAKLSALINKTGTERRLARAYGSV